MGVQIGNTNFVTYLLHNNVLVWYTSFCKKQLSLLVPKFVYNCITINIHL
jgi:hypothetical protein